MLRQVVATIIATGVVLAAGGAPASAQTKVRKDRVGDASSRTDVRSVKVQNNAGRFAVTVRLVDVRRGRTVVAFGSGFSGDSDAGFLVDVYPVAGGRYQARALTGTGEDDVAPLACATRSVTVKRGRGGFVRVVIPQTCLGAMAGRQVTEVVSYDKRALGGALSEDAVGARRGDDPFDPEDFPIDTVSPITTRRG